MDLIITTPEELRAFLPSHTYRNLDTVRGFLVNSQNTFLRQRIGQPLLSEILNQYAHIMPIVPTSIGDDYTPTTDANTTSPWRELILLCQRCIVYDAFARSADIRALTDNDMGMNVAESDNFDAANDKRVDRYKAQLIKESHAASDLLLTQLEEWHRDSVAINDTYLANLQNVPEGSWAYEVAAAKSNMSAEEIAINTIDHLFYHSSTHYLCAGLLFNTATEFNRFIDIYESRDRFIQLMPDIRYCQELYIEAEIGSDLLVYLIDTHKASKTNAIEERAYQMLQRSLSLYVEKRNKMFSVPESRIGECTGYMNLTLKYLTQHQQQFSDKTPWLSSPLYREHQWPVEEGDQSTTHPSSEGLTPHPHPFPSAPFLQSPVHSAHGGISPSPSPVHSAHGGISQSPTPSHHPYPHDTVLVTTLI